MSYINIYDIFWIIGPITHINEIYKTKSKGDK